MKLTEQQCNDFWKMADKDRSGTLSTKELRAALRKYNPNISDIQVEGIFSDIDRDGDESITLAEFKDQMMKRNDRSTTLKKLFDEADVNNDGTLDKAEVRKLIAQAYDAKSVDKAVEGLFKYCDKDGDNTISRAEFEKFFG